MNIRRRHRNQIAEAITESPFPRREFEVAELDSEISLRHTPTDSSFLLHHENSMNSNYEFESIWCVGTEPGRREEDDSPGALLDEWLRDLQEYTEMPDLWSELLEDPGVAGLVEERANTPFDATEQGAVAAWAAETKQNAAHLYDLNLKQMKALETKLDYVVEASGRLGRIDWLNASVGALMGIAMNDALSSSIAQQILRGLVSSVAHLFGHPITLIGPGL